MPRLSRIAITATLSAALTMPAAAAFATAPNNTGNTDRTTAQSAAETAVGAPLIGVSDPKPEFVRQVEQALGRPIGVARTFNKWGSSVTPVERSLAASGHALMPSFMVAGGATGPTYAGIASGRYDTWLKSSLRAYDALGVRVWWIPQQEINRPAFKAAGTPAQAKAFLSHIARVAASLHLQHVLVTPALICARFSQLVNDILPSPYPFATLGMITANADYSNLNPALDWLKAHPGIRLVIPEFEGSPPPRGSVPDTREALVNFRTWAKAHADIFDAAAYYAGHITLSSTNGTLPLFVDLANDTPFR